VDLRVSLVREDGDDQTANLESLSDWLRGSPELAGRVTDDYARTEGELGALSDALVVSVGSGGTLSVLAMSLKAWLAQPRKSRIRIRVKNHRGRIVEIDADRVDRDEIEAIIRDAIEGVFPEK
jgi:hypothetical protein